MRQGWELFVHFRKSGTCQIFLHYSSLCSPCGTFIKINVLIRNGLLSIFFNQIINNFIILQAIFDNNLDEDLLFHSNPHTQKDDKTNKSKSTDYRSYDKKIMPQMKRFCIMIVFAIEKSVSLDQVARYIKLIGHPMFFI
jgi:hypothetical protein